MLEGLLLTLTVYSASVSLDEYIWLLSCKCLLVPMVTSHQLINQILTQS